MINNVYQLVSPRTIVVKFEDMPTEGRVLVRPRAMAVCHADQRYFQGRRDAQVLRRKLPMALIHECVGEVLADPTGTFQPGQQVVLIPNIPGREGEGLYENYAPGSAFRSSGHDGFMRDVVSLPADRVVDASGLDMHVAAIAEFVSVAVHACRRLEATARTPIRDLVVVGDGSLGFVTACVASTFFPEASLSIVGRNQDKLALFSFAAHRYFSDEVPADVRFDHGFECAGGEGSSEAINFVIAHARPQANLMLMGVSEHPVAVNTRDVLERGMTLVGCSRSGREDFERALSIMRSPGMQERLRQIVYVGEPVTAVADIKRAFATDLQTPFKTVFEWRM